MIDYAKDSTTELYNIFYEFDDILEMPYIALEAETGSETTPATVPATTSSTTTLATVSASNAQKSDNENPTTDNDAKKDQGKPVTPSNLRSSSGLSKKLTELMNKLSTTVKEAIENAGLTTQDFAGYCEWEKEDGTTGCGLRYSEFIAMCINEIQKLKKRIDELEAQQND